MKKIQVLVSLILFGFNICLAQSEENSETFWKPNPPNYSVSQAFEIEAVPFVYLSGGYHASIGYRYKKFRFRVSVIDAGTFDSDNSTDDFERFETSGTFGVFAGYNVWKNLETYVFIDRQVFDIKQVESNEINTLKAVSPGLGVSYQFFIGRHFYIQPGLHLYTRGSQTMTFTNGENYELSSIDFFPVVRLGVRLWKKYE